VPDRIDILWSAGGDGTQSSQPLPHQRGSQVQQFDTLRLFPMGLAAEHWLVRGHTFYELHLLLDKHAEEQAEMVDTAAVRV
jgi:starvation-inducible DNA-binding protein